MGKTTILQNDTDKIVSGSEEHSIWKSIILHLLPGILGGIVYFLIVNFMREQGFPSVSALIVAGVLVITPLELSILIFQSRKNKKKLFGGFLAYLQPLPVWQYIVWVIIIIISSGLIITLFTPITDYLRGIFHWIPNEMILDMGLSGVYSKTALIVTYAFILIFVVLIGPAVEELYFRGYLLPRMSGKLSNLQHSFLFAVYHVFTPWMIITRMIGLLPLIYVVKKKNIYIGIIVHILVNLIDAVMGFAFIAGMA